MPRRLKQDGSGTDTNPDTCTDEYVLNAGLNELDVRRRSYTSAAFRAVGSANGPYEVGKLSMPPSLTATGHKSHPPKSDPKENPHNSCCVVTSKSLPNPDPYSPDLMKSTPTVAVPSATGENVTSESAAA